MRRIKLLGAALVAVFALGVVAAASASAVEPTKILPEPTAANPLTSTGTSGLNTLTTRTATLVCTDDRSTVTSPTPNTFNFTWALLGCKARVPVIGSVPCTGEGDEKEKILIKAEGHYWLALLSSKLVAALILLFGEIHFTCEALGQKQLFIVKGCAAALAEPTEKLTKITKGVFMEEKSGVSDIREVLPPESTKEIKCITEASVNGGAFEEAAIAATEENEKFELGKKAVEVLLMNK